MSPLNFDDPQWPHCWKPIKERVRHLTDELIEPPKGIVSYFLCGGTILAGNHLSGPVLYDCAHCADVHVEHSLPPVTRPVPRPEGALPAGLPDKGPRWCGPHTLAGPHPLGGTA